MKNIILATSLVSTLLLNACGGNNESSETASSGGKISFNLGQHLMNNGVRSSHKEVTIDSRGLTVGTQSNFMVTSNFTVNSTASSIAAQYYSDVTILRKQIGGHAIDLSAKASTDKLAAGVNLRVLGQSLYSNEVTSQKSYSFTRDIGVTIPYPILPALSVNLGGKLGGEIGFSVAPGLSSDKKSVQLSFDPTAKLSGIVQAKAVGIFAEAGASGTVDVLKAEMPVVASAGSSGGSLKVGSLNIKTLSGHIDLTASLSVGNILPGSMADLWKKIFGNGLSYSHALISWEGFPVLSTSAKTYTY